MRYNTRTPRLRRTPLTTRQKWILILAAVPAVALFALLAWALVRTGGNPGGLGVNAQLGEKPTASRQAPDFSLPNLDETATLNLVDYRGKVLMLDFWSSWCPPCRVEAPVLSQIYREYSGLPVEFIGVAIWDDAHAISTFANEFAVPYPLVVDEKGRVAIDYGVAGIPEKFFIDQTGTLQRSFVGPMSPKALRNILDEMLEQ